MCLTTCHPYSAQHLCKRVLSMIFDCRHCCSGSVQPTKTACLTSMSHQQATWPAQTALVSVTVLQLPCQLPAVPVAVASTSPDHHPVQHPKLQTSVLVPVQLLSQLALLGLTSKFVALAAVMVAMTAVVPPVAAEPAHAAVAHRCQQCRRSQ